MVLGLLTSLRASSWLTTRRTVAVIGVLVLLGSAMGVIYVQSSPEYSLYKMHKAVAKNDPAEFLRYWQVRYELAETETVTKENFDGEIREQAASYEPLSHYRENYYYPLSLWAAFNTTQVSKESISDGAIIFVSGKAPVTAMRVIREQGHWVFVEFAQLP